MSNLSKSDRDEIRSMVDEASQVSPMSVCVLETNRVELAKVACLSAMPAALDDIEAGEKKGKRRTISQRTRTRRKRSRMNELAGLHSRIAQLEAQLGRLTLFTVENVSREKIEEFLKGGV